MFPVASEEEDERKEKMRFKDPTVQGLRDICYTTISNYQRPAGEEGVEQTNVNPSHSSGRHDSRGRGTDRQSSERESSEGIPRIRLSHANIHPSYSSGRRGTRGHGSEGQGSGRQSSESP